MTGNGKGVGLVIAETSGAFARGFKYARPQKRTAGSSMALRLDWGSLSRSAVTFSRSGEARRRAVIEFPRFMFRLSDGFLERWR